MHHALAHASITNLSLRHAGSWTAKRTPSQAPIVVLAVCSNAVEVGCERPVPDTGALDAQVLRIFGHNDGYGTTMPVKNPIQPKPGVFNETALQRFDFVMNALSEVRAGGCTDMSAVVHGHAERLHRCAPQVPADLDPDVIFSPKATPTLLACLHPAPSTVSALYLDSASANTYSAVR